MSQSLSGATALVTGADTEIGQAMLKMLHQAGVRIAAHTLAPASIAHAELSFHAAPTDEAALTESLAKVAEHFGTLNLLITCHGEPHTGALVEQDSQAFWQHVDNQLTGSYLFARLSAELLIKAEWARVILTCSSWAIGGKGLSAVATASAGTQILCKTLARELGPHGVTVNALAHAFTDTQWLACDAAALGLSQDQIANQAGALVPAGTLGRAEQIAQTAKLLCQPVIGAAVAQTLQCNGGFLRHRT